MCRKWIALLLLLTGCAVGSGSIPTPNGEQAVTLNIGEEPPTLDPGQATDTTSLFLLRSIGEGLTRIDPTGNPVEALAEKIKFADDGRTYIFTLRDATWSDGSPVTAQDFVFAWQRILTKEFPSGRAEELYLIKNARAVKRGELPREELGLYAADAKTLVVTLEFPVPYFLEAISNPEYYPLPQRVVEKNPDWHTEARSYVSCGPFLLHKWRHDNEIVLKKNPTYWDAKHVVLEEVKLLMVDNSTTELNLYEAGNLDWAGAPFSNLPVEALPQLRERGELLIKPMAATYFYLFNTTVEPFNSPTMRHALNLAISRKAIIENVLQGKERPAIAVVPDLMQEYPPVYFGDGDLDRAKKLFQQALHELDISRREVPEITIHTNYSEHHLKVAQAIQQQWREAFGLKVSIQQEGWKSYLGRVTRGDYMVARMSYVAQVNDPTEFLKRFGHEGSPNNVTRWDNPEYVALLEQAQASHRLEKRKRLLKMAENLLMEHLPGAPIYQLTATYLKKDNLHGVYLSDLGNADLKWAYRSSR